MKKTITSLVLAASMMLNAVPMTSTAEEVDEKSYTYNELLEMTDEEVAELLSEDKSYKSERFLKYGFGDDSISDTEKFEKFFGVPAGWFERESTSLDHIVYSDTAILYRSFLKEYDRRAPYMEIRIEKDIELDYDLTAENFGFPSDWQIRAIDVSPCGTFTTSENEHVIRAFYIHHCYKIEIPLDVLTDFEKYARLVCSTGAVDTVENVYAVKDMYEVYLLLEGRAPFNCGDVNLDYEVNMADAVTIMQWAANPDKHHLTNAAQVIGDVYGNDGLTARDALEIQKYMLKQVEYLYVPQNK